MSRAGPGWDELVIGIDRMDDVANETGAAVAIVLASGGEPTYLTDLSLFGYQPDWSPTGDRIVFSVQVREAMASLTRGRHLGPLERGARRARISADDTRTAR